MTAAASAALAPAAAPDAPPQWRDAFAARDTTLRLLEHFAAVGGFAYRGTVVDVGCGYGHMAVMAAALGADRAIGVDVDRERLDLAREALGRLLPGLADRVTFTEGAAEALALADASVDVLLSVEGAGVYPDLPGFLDECARVVRPGGVVLISELNNGLHPRLRRQTLELWEHYERGPVPVTLHDHEITATYEQERAAVIAAAAPQLAAADVARLARETSGLRRADVVAAAQRMAQDGTTPGRTYEAGTLPTAPNGMVVERMVDPRALALELHQRGFDARAVGYWGGAGGHPLVRAANRVLAAGGGLTLPRARSFRVVGRRR